MIEIRRAIAADAGELASLSGQLGYPVDPPGIARRVGDIAGHGFGVVLVAVDAQGRVRGFAHAVPQYFLIVDPFVDLAALVVAESARGQGIGATLLAAVETWAREQGFADLRVRSNVVRERAHRFYLRAGYVERKRQAVFVKRLGATIP